MEAMCFYQVAVEDVASDDDDDDDDDDGVMVVNIADEISNDTDAVIIHEVVTSIVDELLVAYVFDVHNPPSLLNVLTRASTIQHKNDLPRWIRQMTKKLSSSGIDNTFDLMSRIHSLNEDLQAHG